MAAIKKARDKATTTACLDYSKLQARVTTVVAGLEEAG